MKLEYREMKKEDLPEICRISDIQFGKSYITRDDFLRYLDEKDFKLPVLCISGKVIGFSIIQIMDIKSLLQNFPALEKSFIRHQPSGDMVQVRKTTCLDIDQTSKGYGSSFINWSIDKYSKNCQYVISINWKRKRVIPMHRISRKSDMSVLSEIKDFWKKESIEKAYECAECGEAPCRCTAVFYYRMIY